MYKKSISILSIIANSLGIFFEKFPSFLKYMAYPLFGQLAGVIVCFVPFLTSKTPENINIPLVFICMIAGLVLFCHAFWRYLLISGGLVLVSRQIVENEPLQEFDYYTKVFEKRSKEYITYLLIMLLISLLFVVPTVAWAFIIFVKYYNAGAIDATTLIGQFAVQALIFGFVIFLVGSVLSIAFETFVLNPNLEPPKGILKAIKLSGRNYFPNLGLLILLVLIGAIWSEVFGLVLNKVVFNETFYVGHPKEYANMLSLIQGTTQGCIAGMLLPFMTLCRTWWYLRMEQKDGAKMSK